MTSDANHRPRCIILGGGGHARVLIDILQLRDEVTLHGILDANQDLWGKELYGVPFLGGDDLLPEVIAQGVDSFVVGRGSTGDYEPRKRLWFMGLEHGLEPINVIHPNVYISRHATIGRGAQIFPGCVVNAGARIGDNVIVNTLTSIEHDCTVEDHVHVSAGVHLCGTVYISTGCHIGVASTIKQNVKIGKRVIVGLGAAVINDVPDDTIMVGVPAKPLVKK